jgi:hypothetical protein
MVNLPSRLKRFLKLSCAERPARKPARFRVGQILNPYPAHYKPAFASSGILYPLPHRLTLRLAFPEGEHRVYQISRKYHI